MFFVVVDYFNLPGQVIFVPDPNYVPPPPPPPPPATPPPPPAHVLPSSSPPHPHHMPVKVLNDMGSIELNESRSNSESSTDQAPSFSIFKVYIHEIHTCIIVITHFLSRAANGCAHERMHEIVEVEHDAQTGSCGEEQARIVHEPQLRLVLFVAGRRRERQSLSGSTHVRVTSSVVAAEEAAHAYRRGGQAARRGVHAALHQAQLSHRHQTQGLHRGRAHHHAIGCHVRSDRADDS